MTTRTYTVPGFPSQKYWVYEVDADGNEIAETESGKKGYVLDTIEKEIDASVTDVIVAVHGWNTKQKDNDTLSIFEEWFTGIKKDIEARPYPAAEQRKFIMLGVHWPSAIGSGRADEMIDDDKTFEENADRMRNLAEKLKETDVPAWRRINKIVDEVTAVAHQAATSAQQTVADVAINTATLANKVEKVRESLENPENDNGSDGGSITAEADEEDAEVIRPHTPGGLFRFAQFVVGNVFRPLEQILFGQYLRRAETVGRNGVHTLLAYLQERCPARARFHLLGHSLGGPVLFGALDGPEEGLYLLRKKVHSCTVLQGAVNNRALSAGKRFDALTVGVRPVAGPVVCSTSQSDAALHSFRLFYGEPIGLHGVANVEPLPLRTCVLESVPTEYGLAKGEFFNVIGDKFIDETKDGLDVVGSHGDIYGPELMHMLRQAIDTPVPVLEYRLRTDLSFEFFRERLTKVGNTPPPAKDCSNTGKENGQGRYTIV